MESVKTFKRNANFSGRDKFWEGEITEEDEPGWGWDGGPGSSAQMAAPWGGSLGPFVRVFVGIIESRAWGRMQLRGAKLG